MRWVQTSFFIYAAVVCVVKLNKRERERERPSLRVLIWGVHALGTTGISTEIRPEETLKGRKKKCTHLHHLLCPRESIGSRALGCC